MNMLEKLLAAAKTHGEQSEPDHEVGDLQALLASCWERLTPAAQQEIYEEHGEMVAEWRLAPGTEPGEPR